MSTPQSTPLKQVKLGIVSAKSMPLTNEYKRLLSDQHQRLSLKHQQDLDLIDDIRSYIKARLSIEKDYTNALQKLTKQHSNYINKKFALLAQLDQQQQQQQHQQQSSPDCRQDQQQSSLQGCSNESTNKLLAGSAGSNSDPSSSAGDRNVNRNQTSVNNNNNTNNNNNNSSSNNNNSNNNSNRPSSLYKVWSEHINCLQLAAKNRWDQFEQLNLIVDKLKDIRQHKASIGKKCLDTHLKPIQEDLLLSLIDVERAKKLYYEDESQARKARENEERIKKKRSGLLTKFTDLQAKKEKSSAQREANDIQSTQARNDYIMALAAANAYLKYYYQRDLNDFIHLIDDGVLDHCKIFMATLSECEINWLKYSLSHAQNWSKLINLTGSQQTNYIFLECEQSKCLRTKQELAFEPCNSDPIQKISLEHNADYALQHEIDKWFTWFKKECRNLSQLMHQLDTYQSAFVEGKKSIEVNGQTIDDLEPKIVNLKQQIRKCEAAKLRAQARLKAIKEGGMQIEEWSEVELEIRADMARAQEEQQRAQRLKETRDDKSMDDFVQGGGGGGGGGGRSGNDYCDEPSSSANDGLPDQGRTMVQLQVSKDSDDSDVHAGGDSIHNLASVSRSNSNLVQKQQNAITGYSALTDPSLVWQDDHSSSAWGGATGGSQAQPGNIVVSHSFNDQLQQQQQQPSTAFIKSPTSSARQAFQDSTKNAFDPLGANQAQQQSNDKQKQQIPTASMSIQSSSPLSAIMNGGQHLSQSPYQGIMSEAYKSDYECDYTRTGQHATIRSAASSAEPAMYQLKRNNEQAIEFGSPPGDIQERMDENNFEQAHHEGEFDYGAGDDNDDDALNVSNLLNKRVIALYNFDKNNEDDLAFNEGDLLLVIETNPDDTNWIKAQSMSSGESGFIPSSYVRLFDDNNDGGDGDGDGGQRRLQNDTSNTHQSSAWPVAVSCDERAVGKQEQEQEHGPPGQEKNETHSYTSCRALYDYTPEANAFEDDGLPHLSLRQGELMHIIDQGDDDGWWLVEKQDEQGTRGHVPSMLVEEMDSNEDGLESNDDDDDGDEFDDDDDGELSDDMHEGSGPIKGPPPSFEPPVLEHDHDASKPTVVESKFNENFDASDGTLAQPANGGAELIINKAEEQQQQQDEGKEASKTTTTTTDNSSLIPTSFIIIEPTPEVESRRFEDNANEFEGDSAHQSGVNNSSKIIDATENSSDVNPAKRDAVEMQEADNQPPAPPPLPSIEQQQQQQEEEAQQQQQTHRDQSTRQVVHSRQPPSQISYSIVNEDFVLEKPTRRPHQQSASNSLDNASGHHHEPTIVEEEDSCQNEIISSSRNSVPPSCDGGASGNGGGGDDDDDDGAESDYRINMPAPPEVVIDSVEAIPRSPDLSFDEDDANKDVDGNSTQDPDGDSQKSETSTSTSERKPIKHTNYANVSPILRHHAEEFCKQLIEEAIMLAPGSQIGPSTSSANVSLAGGGGSPNNGANEADHDNDNDFEHGGSFEDSN